MAFLNRTELRNLGFKKLGDNVMISDKASIYSPQDISIGNNVRIDDFAILSPGEKGFIIGNYVHIACHTTLIGRGRIVVQDFCGISARTNVYSSNDDYSGMYLTNPTVDSKFTNVTEKDVIIKKHSIIGAGSVILPGVTLGIGTSVGALSFVNRSTKDFDIVIGSPAKFYAKRSENLLKLEKEFLNK
jgi:acetyltransferase-like isoleucine patch superfamily enzyme